MVYRLITCLILALHTTASLAADAWQSLDAIQTAVEAFVTEQVATQPGEYKATVSRLDPRLKLSKCDQLTPFRTSGNRLWGNTSIGVRCATPKPWSIYVPVHIKVNREVLVTTKPLASGQALTAEDVRLQRRDITAFAGSTLSGMEQIEGKIVTAPVAEGSVLRTEMLRAGQIVRQGQQVKLIAQGAGFRVSSEGVAMSNATAGQVVGVKTRSGQIIKGVAKSEGVVEVYF